MEWLEVRNEKGELVWKSPEVETMAIDRVGNTVKVIDLSTSQVHGGHIVRPGELVLKMPAGTQVKV